MREDREFDLVVFGATGFVGQLVAEYLAEQAPRSLRIALAGRSLARLEVVRAELGTAAQGWPLLVADAGDRDALDVLVARTRVVATTVGPYVRYGLPLAEACSRAGTDYLDLAGEVLFVRETLARFAELAKDSGARIVHSCGFDSIPSDLGVLVLAEAARADGAGHLTDTSLVVRWLRGAMSGGTVETARALADAVRTDPELVKVLLDPYALSPDRAAEPDLGRQSDRVKIRRDASVDAWVGAFFMAPYNTRIVRLSNALQGFAYGREFCYREAMSFGSGPLAPLRAHAMSAGVSLGMAGLAFGPSRRVLDRFLPKPGEGPDEQSRRSGGFRMELRASTASGAAYRCVVEAQGDPGQQATSVMMGESALALLVDRAELPDSRGVLTPAAGLGSVLARRLRGAGFTIDVESLPGAPNRR